MNAQEKRQHAIQATRGHMRVQGINPTTATAKDIEFAVSEADAEFSEEATDNQWKLFIAEFKKLQKEN